MKKLLVCCLTLSLLFCTLPAMAEDASLTAAKSLVPATATLTETDRERASIQYEFRDDTARYDVLVDTSGAPLLLEVTWPVRDAQSATLDETAALTAAAPLLPETAETIFTLLEQDDRRYSWRIFAADETDLYTVTLNAETGETIETEQFFGAKAMAITPDALLSALIAAKGEMTLVELELDIDEDSLILEYNGKAQLDGGLYEFEASAADGRIIEWERD